MITINLSEKQASELKSMMNSFMPTRSDRQRNVVDEVRTQISNQQFDVGDFESSRQYEALIVQGAGFIPKNEFTKGKRWRIKKLSSEYSYLDNWDKATKK